MTQTNISKEVFEVKGDFRVTYYGHQIQIINARALVDVAGGNGNLPKGVFVTRRRQNSEHWCTGCPPRFL